MGVGGEEGVYQFFECCVGFFLVGVVCEFFVVDVGCGIVGG